MTEEDVTRAEFYRDMLREDGLLATRKGSKVNINVKYYPSYDEITVQGGQIDEDGTFWKEWCNHGGATEKMLYDSYYDSAREILNESESLFLVCDKCEEVIDELDGDEEEDYCE